MYEHVTHLKTISVDMGLDTIINEDVNVTRRSIKWLLLFFTSHKSLTRETVRRHSILTSLKWRGLSLESPIRFTVKEWREEICGKRSSEDSVRKTVRKMQQTYAGNRFTLVIDLRSMKDNDLYGSELRLVNTKEVQLAINRKLSGSGIIECHILILSDAQFNIINRELESVTY